MAYHYVELGHTKPIIGKLYQRFLSVYSSSYRLTKYNTSTGMCKMVYDGGFCFISVTELSHWYQV